MITFSLLLIYPAGVLNIVIEGKENIYQNHFVGLLIILIAFSAIGMALTRVLKIKQDKCRIGGKTFLMVALIMLVGFVLRILALGEASLNGDEIDLGGQAYDLVDGMVAGREAYFISETAHSPLGFYIAHAFYNLFEPGGYYEMKDWMFRIPQVFMGMLTIFGTYVLSRSLLKKEDLALIPTTLVAIDSYSNFASRLAIFQDLSTFAFFVIVMLMAMVIFMEKKKAGVLAGISFGSLLLVKFVGILFLPIFLFKKKIKPLIKPLLIALGIFSPVIAYNIGAYLKTGYMDVGFAKLANLVGIPAKSIMAIGDDFIYSGALRNPLMTLIEMPFTLLDQWGVALAGVFLWAFIAGIFYFKKSKKNYSLIYAVILLSVVFFSLNGFRTYYFPYFSVIFAILVALNLQHVRKLKTALIILAIIAIPYTLIYNINTNILLKEPDVVTEYGRSGEQNLEITYHLAPYSYGAAGFLSDQGWDELLELFERIDARSGTLVLSENLNYLNIKWYLHVNDIIREHYGDRNYNERYDYVYLTDWEEDPEETFILISAEQKDNSMAEYEVKDKHGNVELYIYF